VVKRGPAAGEKASTESARRREREGRAVKRLSKRRIIILLATVICVLLGAITYKYDTGCILVGESCIESYILVCLAVLLLISAIFAD
jgi:hypothetical protein